jgi:hypothetical protein
VELLLTREVSVSWREHVHAFVEQYKHVSHVFEEMKQLGALRCRVKEAATAFEFATKHARFTQQWLGLLSPRGNKRDREQNAMQHDDDDIVRLCETCITSIRHNVQHLATMPHLEKRHDDVAHDDIMWRE